MVFLLRSLTIFVWLMGGAVAADARPGPLSADALSQAASRYLEAQVQKEWPGLKAKIDVLAPDPRLRLTTCNQLQFALSPGSALQGVGSLGVRCESPLAWALYLRYRIELRGPALVAARPLPAREPLKAADLEIREIDYTAPAGQYLRQPQQAVGLLAKQPLKAGQPLTYGLLVRPLAIRAGQKVRIVVEQPGFSVSQECTAMANANVGDLVRCRVPSGRIVQGVAGEAGTIQVKP